MLGATRGYLRLSMPDYAVIATVCSGFALAWAPLRTGLLLNVLRTPQGARPALGDVRGVS